MFVIEDELHAEPEDGEYKTFEDAIAELQKSDNSVARKTKPLSVHKLERLWKKLSNN